MEWSKTKTIFIITFLILDIFLLYQLVEKVKSSELDPLTETTIEEQLKAEEITYPDNVKYPVEMSYITGKSKMFSPEDFKELTNQKIIIREEKIYSVFTESIAFPEMEKGDKELEAAQFLEKQIVNGTDYVFWDSYEKDDMHLYLFFQTYDGRPMYFNKNGALIVRVDEDNNAVGYIQMYLDDIEKMDLEENNTDIIPAIKVIDNLYTKNELPSGSDITDMKLGYYTLVPLTGGVQVLAPTWRIHVNNEKEFFVNAVEGQINQLKMEEWINNVLQ